LKNITNPNGKSVVDGLTTTGINIGDYTPGSNAYVKFSAKVDGESALLCGPTNLVNKATVQVGTDTKEATATATVNKECIPVVAYTCDALSISPISRTEFKFTTTTSQQNATFKSVTYIIRDAHGKEVERKTSTAKTLDYTQNTVGTYTVQALTTFSVAGSDKTVTSSDCKQPLEVTKTPQEYCTIPGKEQLPKDSPECVETPPVTPPVTPPLLPHTGMSENIVAVVGLGALVASIGYYVASRKALNQ
jgi:LPXTG-motif cell wall-anchored protein